MGPPVLNPVFVIGCPRSGTTLLRLILTSHSGICIPHEYPLFDVVRRYFVADSSRLGDKNVDRLLDEMYRHPHFLDWGIERNVLQDAILTGNRCQASVIDQIYQCHARKMGKPNARWGDKYIKSIDNLPNLARLFPMAKFVHIVRDGRDVYASFQEKNWKKYRLDRSYWTKDFLEVSHLWNRANDLAMGFKNNHPASLMTVRYEDLIANPETVIRSVCTFLAISFESNMLNFHERNLSENLIPASRRNAFHENTTRPIMADNAKKYRACMSAKQIQTFNRNSHELLTHFDYIHVADPVAPNLAYQCSLRITYFKSRWMAMIHRSKDRVKKMLGRK